MIETAQGIESTQTASGPEVLCELLCAQIASAHEGNLPRVEQLCAQAEGVVAQMKGAGSDLSFNDAQRARLKQLYGELILTLQAEHADVGGRLKKLRQVKRAVGAYGGRGKR